MGGRRVVIRKHRAGNTVVSRTKKSGQFGRRKPAHGFSGAAHKRLVGTRGLTFVSVVSLAASCARLALRSRARPNSYRCVRVRVVFFFYSVRTYYCRPVDCTTKSTRVFHFVSDERMYACLKNNRLTN